MLRMSPSTKFPGIWARSSFVRTLVNALAAFADYVVRYLS